MANRSRNLRIAFIANLPDSAMLTHVTLREVAMISNSAISGRRAYAEAGVDIDAGNALVDAIKPLAKATARANCMSNPFNQRFCRIWRRSRVLCRS